MALDGSQKQKGWCFLCILLGALFLCSTAPAVVRGLGGSVAVRPHPFHSTDLYLQSIVNAPDSSQKFVDLVSTWPAQKSIWILVQKDSPRSSLLGMIAAYLAWPHHVRIITVTDRRQVEGLPRSLPDPVAAVVFCEVVPPAWLKGTASIGPSGNFAVAGPSLFGQ